MPHSDDIFGAVYDDQRKRSSLSRLIVLISIVFAAIFFLFFGGEFVQRTIAYQASRHSVSDAPPVSARDTLRDIVVNTVSEAPLSWLRQGLVDSGVPVYDLEIEPNQLARLQDTAEMVTALGEAGDIPREYVSARFLMNREWVPIEVKLRGQTSSHYHSRAPSLRLKFPRDRLFNGKKQINISFLYDKGLTSDITSNWELRRHGILTWDSQFVVLRVNGEVIGLFQEIEQFGRSIWDRNRRSEGYIFAGHGQLFGDEDATFDKALAAIELVKQCDVLPDQPIAELCTWEFFDEYFDIDKWAWSAALTVILNSTHAWNAENLRMYWDPARGTFEPIPWDYLYYPLNPAVHIEGEQAPREYRKSLFNIAEFRRIRDRHIWTLLTTRIEPMIQQANESFEFLSTALSYDLRHFGIEVDREMHEDYVTTLRENKKILMKLFQRHELSASFWTDNTGTYTVEFQNFGKSFVSIEKIVLTNESNTFEYEPDTPVVVNGIWLGQPGTEQISFAAPPELQMTGLTAVDKVTNTNVHASDIRISRSNSRPRPSTPIQKAAELNLDIKGVVVRENAVEFGPGRVEVERTLRIPAFYDVVFNPGLDLAFGDDVSLIIKGNLQSIGTELSPINISGTRTIENWGGIFVHGKRTKPSVVDMTYTRFLGGKGGESKRSYFTSPFSVHDGIVNIQFSEFSHSAADDGINLKYSKVDLRNNLLQDSFSDALDCDFCDGKLVNNSVLNSGGDGLDFSGSNVEIEGNSIDHCADKGISIGERTEATLLRNDVTNCYMGVAIKDSSKATVEGGNFENLQVGIALYVKKLTFGPSEAKVHSVSMRNVATRYMFDDLSSLTILPAEPVSGAPITPSLQEHDATIP